MRADSASWQHLYKTKAWSLIRKRQLALHPLCAMCLDEGLTTAATVCDHDEPHKGDPTKFHAGPFTSLCASHHNSDKQRIEKGGKPKVRIGADGWPAR